MTYLRRRRSLGVGRLGLLGAGMWRGEGTALLMVLASECRRRWAGRDGGRTGVTGPDGRAAAVRVLPVLLRRRLPGLAGSSVSGSMAVRGTASSSPVAVRMPTRCSEPRASRRQITSACWPVQRQQ